MSKHYNAEVRPSNIHGIGLFATKVIKPGDRIWFNFHRCPVNHSFEPNVVRGKKYGMIANKMIKPGDEIVEDYLTLPEFDRPYVPGITIDYTPEQRKQFHIQHKQGKRKNFCRACHNIQFGIKTRISIDHTCGKSSREIISFIEQTKHNHNDNRTG